MALLRILKYPETSLKEPAQEVANIDGKLAGFIDSMTQTMYAAPGVGLAAPQVGPRSASSCSIPITTILAKACSS